MNKNKTHWYDGWFYDMVIAPNQDKLFGKIRTLIEPDKTVLDIGCGTGRLEFLLSDKCKTITGIDLSEKNIKRAELNLNRKHHNNVTFKHIGLEQHAKIGNKKFDYAIITYVIHEVPEEERVNLIKSISEIADEIIIGDYLVPRPNVFWSFLNELVEFAAGRDHYKNFKSFVNKNGIKGLADECSLKILSEIKNYPSTSHIVVLRK